VRYNLDVDKTLTVRLDKKQDEALTRRATELGKTRSELVRELIERGLDEKPLGLRIGHLKGILDLPEPKDALRRRIKSHNWR
jgi:metal-responsive CopG/Arc/MetJ family transcriptional regulator